MGEIAPRGPGDPEWDGRFYLFIGLVALALLTAWRMFPR